MPNYQDLISRDPEEVGEESFEDVESRQRFADSIHAPDIGPNGKCVYPTWKYCYEHNVVDNHQECGLPRYSVLHWDEEAEFRMAHYHGGGDCMCFENYS